MIVIVAFRGCEAYTSRWRDNFTSSLRTARKEIYGNRCNTVKFKYWRDNSDVQFADRFPRCGRRMRERERFVKCPGSFSVTSERFRGAGGRHRCEMRVMLYHRITFMIIAQNEGAYRKTFAKREWANTASEMVRYATARSVSHPLHHDSSINRRGRRDRTGSDPRPRRTAVRGPVPALIRL